MRPITLIPLRNPDDAFLASGAAADIAAMVLDSVLSWTGAARCLAVLEDQGMEELTASRGITAVSLAIPPAPGPFDLAPRVRTAVERLREKSPSARGLLRVNPANPLLDAAMLDRFYTAFLKDPRTPLFSVKACRDHPCQLIRHWRLTAVDVFYLLDSGFVHEDTSLVASWPIFTQRPEEFMDAQRPRVLIQPDKSLRLLFPRPGDRGGRVAGLPGDPESRAVLIETGENEEKRLAYMPDPAHPASHGLRLIPFGHGATFWDDLISIDSAGPDRPVVLPALPRDATALIACFLEEDRDGTYDFADVFAPESAPWGIRKGVLTNLVTGRPIHGRQAFPKVFRPDGSLAACPLDQALNGSVTLNGARAFIVGDEQSIIVGDHIDYLRYLARLRAAREILACP